MTIITVRGGVVVGTYSDTEKFITVIDFDGDTDPNTKEFYLRDVGERRAESLRVFIKELTKDLGEKNVQRIIKMENGR